MVHRLVEEAKKELFTKLIIVDENTDREGQALAINWESIVDNPFKSRIGWLFLNDKRSKFAVDG